MRSDNQLVFRLQKVRRIHGKGIVAAAMLPGLLSVDKYRRLLIHRAEVEQKPLALISLFRQGKMPAIPEGLPGLERAPHAA